MWFANPQEIASGWAKGAGTIRPWAQRTFFSSGRLDPEAHMVAWDAEADAMVWEKIEPAMGTFAARFPTDGMMSGSPTRQSFGAGLVSEIYFEC